MPIEKSQKVKQAIANNIQNYLTTNNIKMTEFGRMLGVTRPAVKFWLEGRNIPDLELFPSICEILNISIYEFIGAEDPYRLTETQIEEIIEAFNPAFDGALGFVVQDNAPAHNAVFRSNDLTDYWNSGQMSIAIANGSFENIFPGDYIIKSVTVNGTTYSDRLFM